MEAALPSPSTLGGPFWDRKRRHKPGSPPSPRPVVKCAGLAARPAVGAGLGEGEEKGKVLRRRNENPTCSFDSRQTAEPLNRVLGPLGEVHRKGLVRTFLERGKEGEEQGTMAALVALCSGLGERKFTRFPAAFACLTNPGTLAGKVSIS